MISMDKKYRTRDGREVKLLMVDAGGFEPVLGAYRVGDLGWMPIGWKADGFYYCPDDPSDYDLIEAKPRHVWWMNIYRCSDDVFVFEPGASTQEEAHEQASSDRIACIRVEFEEGEGLP